jgi:hypothetical protein
MYTSISSATIRRALDNSPVTTQTRALARGNGQGFVGMKLGMRSVRRVVLAFLAVAVWGVCAEQIAFADTTTVSADGSEIASFHAGSAHAAPVAPVAAPAMVQVCNADLSVCYARPLTGAPVVVKH